MEYVWRLLMLEECLVIMTYLDYSTTTPADARVLQAFVETGAACGAITPLTALKTA